MSSDRRPLRARYIGYSKGTENHGDEALVWILKTLLGPEMELVCDEEQFDVLLLGGGTLINQSPWLIDEVAARMDRCGIGAVFGTGVGDPVFWGDHFHRWVPLLERLSIVAVRGPRSVELLRQHGFDRAILCGDPYLVMRPPMTGEPRPGRIAINAGSTNNSLWGGGEEDFARCLGEFAGRLRREGNEIIWYSVWQKDIAFLREVARSAGIEEFVLYDARAQTAETLAMLSTCEAVVGEKLHALAMSAVAGTPFLALEYQPKVRDFAESIGMGDCTIRTSDRDPKFLAEKLDSVRARRETIAGGMVTAVARCRETVLETAREIKAIAVAGSGGDSS